MEIQLDVEHSTPYSKSSQQKKIVGFFYGPYNKEENDFFPPLMTFMDHFEGLDTSDYYWDCRVSRS